jgi:hypothetical protein
VHAAAARKQEDMLEPALNKKIDDVIGELQMR